MLVNDDIKNQIQQINNIESNSYCFDCETSPAHWASVKNGIFLCFNCAEEHKKFDLGTNIIKSTTLDSWTNEQLNLMKSGGNKKLSEFLNQHDIPLDIEKSTLYNSKIMNYYKNNLKSEANGEINMEPLPQKEEYLDSIQNEEINIFKDNKNFYGNLIYGMNMIELPQNSIMIDEDQYNIAKERKLQELKEENSVLRKNRKYSNDPKYSHISDNNEDGENNGNYLNTVGRLVNTVWDTSKNAAIAVTDKMREYRVGAAIWFVGEKVYVGMAYVGGKLYGVGNVLINNEVTHSFVNKAGEGLIYIKNKITGNNEENENELEVIENNYMLSNRDENVV